VPTGVAPLTAAEFRTNAATGTTTWPDNLNDNDTAAFCAANVIGKYAEVVFPAKSFISQYRYYGNNDNNNDGVSKIQCWNGSVWVDNTIDIPTRGASWSSWKYLNFPCMTTKIRFVCVTVDTRGENKTGELEIIG